MKKLLYFFFFLLTANICFATNMAGDISYTHISGFTYKITIRTFADASPWASDRCFLPLYYGDGDSVAIPRVNGPRINCPFSADGVIITACTGNIRSNIYETTHTYPGSGTYMITMGDANGRVA
jgi:hypothetical protein